MLDYEDTVESYCYIDFERGNEEVFVLAVEGSDCGKFFPYSELIETNLVSLMYNLSDDTDGRLDVMKYFVPKTYEEFQKENGVDTESGKKAIKTDFENLGYPPYYIPQDSTINVETFSKALKKAENN